MGRGVKEDKTMTKGGSGCFKLSVIFLLLNISSFVVPVTAFSLKYCRISYNVAICSGSKLKSVPQDIPSTVNGLDLSVNKIQIIQASDFKTLSVLTQLDLKRNLIDQIHPGTFANLISLKKLNLNNNRLVQLADDLFDGLSNLTELRLYRNHIGAVSSTSFKSLTSLTFLDISKNKLHHITQVHTILQHLPNLQELVVKKNNFTTFQSWELTNSSLKLASLDLSQNPIAVFRITADVFPNLAWLNIGGSSKKLRMKWDVHNKTFLSRVSTLDISGLQITSDDMKTLRDTFNSSLTSLRMNAMTPTNLSALINISCTIPTLSALQLQRNRLFYVRSNFFQLCINVKEIDLSDNLIRRIEDQAFTSLHGLRILSLNHNKLTSVPPALRNLTTLEELNLSKNNISTLQCNDFANLTKLRQLSLHQNVISALQECVFKNLIRLQVLKLQNNTISKLNGAFKKYLPNLKQLRLNGNKLTAIKRREFMGLQSLQNLSLHENQIGEVENGSFIGLTNLTDIQLQSNDIKKAALDKGGFNHLINLIRLDLRDNHIKYSDSSPLPDPPFSQLSRLETLAIPGQHSRGKSKLPSNFLQGLTNLLDFSARNIQLLSLANDTFNYTPRLQTLDISSNDLKELSPELFSPIQSLKSLYVSRTSLWSLDFLMDAKLTKLEFLQARKNEYSILTEELFNSTPALVYLDLQGNSFTCACDNASFKKWALKNTQTQVFDAYNFMCNYPPDLKNTKLLDLDIRSCTVDTGFIYYISTTFTILLFMVVSFTYHFLRWQLAYAYYLFLALLFETKHKNKQAYDQYDAFISYNTHDEPWVIRELLPKLEGEQGWRLCLHHRDFEPGKLIIDNITDAIYGSRKTICVISRRYLESEWCSREIQVASFRLFDEQKDVLILVFLEEIPTTHLSPYYRMRKLLKKKTYLSWPQAEEHPELFWEKLRQALNTREDLGDNRFLLVDRP
ncbi:toll-like receptor 13 [Sander lucioperca]|uniref:Toll-like receptor 22 n=1 Tax=Sander lucioperca TaxID=283035 RepID=A0A8C9Z849_SANLU|nr:toll-like receptor 13 [Sander lucioperca]XP_035854158.1 toll-like receptor 13 [Sander lucioperca]